MAYKIIISSTGEVGRAAAQIYTRHTTRPGLPRRLSRNPLHTNAARDTRISLALRRAAAACSRANSFTPATVDSRVAEGEEDTQALRRAAAACSRADSFSPAKVDSREFGG